MAILEKTITDEKNAGREMLEKSHAISDYHQILSNILSQLYQSDVS